MALTYGTVTGRFVTGAGDGGDPVPASGTVTFRPSPLRILAAGEPAIILPEPVVVTLDADGHIGSPAGVQLVATDDEGLNPLGWTWRADCDFGAFWTFAFDFELSGGSTLDLATASPVPSADGTTTVVGPPGPQGPPGGPGVPPSEVDFAAIINGEDG